MPILIHRQISHDPVRIRSHKLNSTCKCLSLRFNGRSYKICALILLVLCFICSGFMPLEDDKIQKKKSSLSLKAVHLTEKVFDPDKKKNLGITFSPSKKCLASLTIADSFGKSVRKLIINEPVSKKGTTVMWDGRDPSGNMVPQGVYFYLIELTDEQGQGFKYNPYHKTHGKRVTTTAWFDNEKGEIKYQLPQASYVRMRMGLKDGGPLLATPLDWTPMQAGAHILKWNGKDASENIDVASHPKRKLSSCAYSLADNSIIVRGTGNEINRDGAEHVFDPLVPGDRYFHSKHMRDKCHEPRIFVELGGDYSKNNEGITVVNGIVPVRISISPEDWAYLENSRYEIIF